MHQRLDLIAQLVKGLAEGVVMWVLYASGVEIVLGVVLRLAIEFFWRVRLVRHGRHHVAALLSEGALSSAAIREVSRLLAR